MKTFRRTLAVGILAAAACGCKSNGFGTLGRAKPPAAVPTIEVAQVVARHNRDALLVTSFQAEPAVAVSPQTGRSLLPGGSANGKIYIEPPRNFRLVLKAMLKERLDVGSNEESVWLWSPDSFGNFVYTCNYDDSGSIPLSGLYQPDWLMEAMGLAPLPDPESAAGVTVRNERGEAILEQRRTGPDGGQLIKETVISGLDGRIAEHRLISVGVDGKKTPIARAIVQSYQRHELASADGGTPRTVELPASFRLVWPAESLDVTVKLQNARVNAGFEPEKQARYFNIPKNAAKRDLREALGLSVEPNPEITARETRPESPPPVRLGEPLSSASQGASSRMLRRADLIARTSSRRPHGADLPPPVAEPPIEVETLVGAGWVKSPTGGYRPAATERVPNWRGPDDRRP